MAAKKSKKKAEPAVTDLERSFKLYKENKAFRGLARTLAASVLDPGIPITEGDLSKMVSVARALIQDMKQGVKKQSHRGA